MSESEETRSVEDQWVDRVVPETLDWRQLVRDHPLTSVSVVGLLGYVVGRYQGDRLMDLARDVVKRQVDDSIGRYSGFVNGAASDDESPDGDGDGDER